MCLNIVYDLICWHMKGVCRLTRWQSDRETVIQQPAKDPWLAWHPLNGENDCDNLYRIPQRKRWGGSNPLFSAHKLQVRPLGPSLCSCSSPVGMGVSGSDCCGRSGLTGGNAARFTELSGCLVLYVPYHYLKNTVVQEFWLQLSATAHQGRRRGTPSSQCSKTGHSEESTVMKL